MMVCYTVLNHRRIESMELRLRSYPETHGRQKGVQCACVGLSVSRIGT